MFSLALVAQYASLFVKTKYSDVLNWSSFLNNVSRGRDSQSGRYIYRHFKTLLSGYFFQNAARCAYCNNNLKKSFKVSTMSIKIKYNPFTIVTLVITSILASKLNAVGEMMS